MYIGALNAEGEALGCDHPCFGCPVRDHAICNALANPDLAVFRRSGSKKMLASGETLCWQGDAATHVFTLTRGVLRLSKLLSDGRRQVAGFAFPGDFLGVTMEDEHPFTAEAVGEAELCQFTHARFDAFVESHPELERRLFAAATRELSATRDQLMLLGRKTAAERLASFILQMAGRTAQTAGEPMQARLPMSRMDIADYLGLRIETVSRELSALKSGRLIRMMGVHELHVVAPERLTELAAGCAAHEMT